MSNSASSGWLRPFQGLDWLNLRAARLTLLAVVTALAWVGFVLMPLAPVRSPTSVNYLVGAPALTVSLLAYWRGWDPARYIVVGFLSVLLASTVPLPPEGWQNPPQGLLLPATLATLLTGPRWIVGSALIVFGVLIARAGSITGVMPPQPYISMTIMVACLAGARLVLEASVRQAQLRAEQAEQARAEAEEARREADRRAHESAFQAELLNAVDTALVATTTDGTIVYWNRGAEKLFGSSAAERLGKPIRLGDDPVCEDLLRHILAAQPFEGEVAPRHRGRGFFPALVNSWPFYDARGEFAGSVGVIVDLTERRRIEDELRQSAARLRQAQRVARLGVWEWNVRTDVTIWSDEMFEIYGISAAEFTGRGQDYIDQTHPEDRATQIANIQAAIVRARRNPQTELTAEQRAANLQPNPNQFRIIRPDGTIRWVEGDAVVHVDESGEPTWMLGVLIDITDRKLAELASREAQDLTQAILQNTVDGIIRMRDDGVILSVNRSGEAIFGYAADQLVGQNIKILMPEPDHSAHDDYLARYRETGKASIIGAGRETVGRRQDGTLVQIDLAVAEFWFEGQRQFVGTLRDITARKQLEEQLRQAQKMEALGQMASGIAHDFNNALTMIVGGVEILQLKESLLQDEAEVRRYLRLMSTAAADASNVVGRLRELYRPRAEGAPFQPVDLARLVHESVELTRPRWESQAQAAGAQIEVRTGFAATPRVLGSAAELREALINLIFNAVDAMPAGGTITIRIRVIDGEVMLSVSDTGVGMPEDVRQRCLEPFFTTKGEGGSGLGLGMVYGVAKRHDARLTIESTMGVGTTVTLHLPLSDEASPTAMGGATEAEVQRLHVLVVDDEPKICDIVREYLLRDGHTVEVAHDGGTALDRLVADSFDLLITDRAMPGLSGDQIAVAARRLTPKTRIIMLTGFGQLMRANDERPPDVDLVLNKPLQPVQLRRAINTVMRAAPPAD